MFFIRWNPNWLGCISLLSSRWLVSLIDLKVQIARGITFLTPVAMLNILSQTFVWQQNKANFSGNWKLI